MNQVPMSVWADIAEKTTLRTSWAREMFALTETQMEATLRDQAATMARSGIDNKVILAYQEIAPIWIERRAITDYIRQTGQFDLRATLPDLTSAKEAVGLMNKEYRLSRNQRAKLRQLIERMP